MRVISFLILNLELIIGDLKLLTSTVYAENFPTPHAERIYICAAATTNNCSLKGARTPPTQTPTQKLVMVAMEY